MCTINTYIHMSEQRKHQQCNLRPLTVQKTVLCTLQTLQTQTGTHPVIGAHLRDISHGKFAVRCLRALMSNRSLPKIHFHEQQVSGTSVRSSIGGEWSLNTSMYTLLVTSHVNTTHNCRPMLRLDSPTNNLVLKIQLLKTRFRTMDL